MASDLLYAFLVYPIIFIFPAWVANAAPVIFGGGAPLDFGRKIKGKPVFGSHKTIRGTVAGLVAGYLVTLALWYAVGYAVLLGIALSTGAIAGDLLGSFMKRRFGVKEGASIPVMDQYMFLIFALLFAFPFGGFPDYVGLLVVFVLTGLLHVLLNKAAHGLHIKKVPW